MKSKNEIIESVNSLNKLIDQRIKIVKNSESVKDNFVQYFLSCDDEIIFDIFGDFGNKLKNVFNDFDLLHPQISYCCDSFFSLDKPFFKKIREIFELRKIIQKEEFSFVVDLLNNSFKYENDLKFFINKIKSFASNKLPARLIKDPEKRNYIRKLKKIQSIDLNFVYKRGSFYLDSLLKDFNSYIRFDQSQVNELKQITDKINRYKELGCNFLAEDLKNSTDGQIVEYGSQYFGFNRINLITCALVLAKFLDIEMNLNRFQISSSFFEDAWKCHHMYFDYKPKVYPYYELEFCSSDYIKEIISYLDKMPDANEKPIFDSFSVLVPTSDIDKDIELELIKNGILKSVLIGEKDNWCYFLCFFN